MNIILFLTIVTAIFIVIFIIIPIIGGLIISYCGLKNCYKKNKIINWDWLADNIGIIREMEFYYIKFPIRFIKKYWHQKIIIQPIRHMHRKM